MKRSKEETIQILKSSLIVSCQMETHAPGYTDTIIESLIHAAIWGGAKGLRINGIKNIETARQITDLPIIGLVKVFRDDSDVFMTPSMKEVDAVVKAGADIVAIDGTDRLIDQKKAQDIIKDIKQKYPELCILADVRDEKDALESLKLGADFVAPTFYRFKEDAKSTDLPDWEMFAKMCRISEGLGYVLMEGKVWTPDDAIRALHYGAHAVIVGSAITRAHIITRRFNDHLEGFKEKRELLY